eukprot:98012-Rhodomonas_salina.3
MLSGSPGVGDIGIEGGRSWDSRDASFGWATAFEDWVLGVVNPGPCIWLLWSVYISEIEIGVG